MTPILTVVVFLAQYILVNVCLKDVTNISSVSNKRLPGTLKTTPPYVLATPPRFLQLISLHFLHGNDHNI